MQFTVSTILLLSYYLFRIVHHFSIIIILYKVILKDGESIQEIKLKIFSCSVND